MGPHQSVLVTNAVVLSIHTARMSEVKTADEEVVTTTIDSQTQAQVHNMDLDGGELGKVDDAGKASESEHPGEGTNSQY
ncbi:hypothetical protein NDU88_002985 [Pleurodeles waltl]|uniref:Uncharacterized protein n=1 Tax=Pleurodeles waltl TaxID=8319 RepID=A0AAV7WR37_PLEWA|nr:hypothetical protein NDU88_002985 [Pleurodeles waltl]